MKSKLLPLLMLFCMLSCQNVPQWQSLPMEEWPSNDGQYSLLVSKKGETVFEKYYNQADKAKLCNVQSLTKSIMALLVGIAIDQGKIPSVEEPIAAYFPNIFNSLKDNSKQQITIKHILNQTSGLAWSGYVEHEEWLKSEQPNLFVLAKKMNALPGEKYNYNSGATHLLTQIITKATGKSVTQFAKENLFTPLNINMTKWEIRKDGNNDGSGLGLWMQADDLLKIGQLMLAKGQWNGQQLISEHWIQTVINPELKSKATIGLPRSKHGYCWYSTQRNDMEVYYGMGYGGQFIFLFPKEDMVIVTTHNHDTPDGIDQQVQFLTHYLPGLLKTFGE